jgi:hypothetical protein
MKHAKPGVTLTELVVFLWIFALLAVAVVTFLARSSVLCVQFNKKSDQVAVVTSAGDWLARDLRGADPQRDTINVLDESLAMLNSQEKIRWKLKDGIVMRTVQRFDAAENGWKKPYTSHVAHDVTTLAFKQIVKDGHLKGIVCTMTYTLLAKEENIVYRCALRNGVV